MSETEYNKGSLTKVSMSARELYEEINPHTLLDHYYKGDYLEYFRESYEYFMVLNGEIYRVNYEVKSGQMLDEFCNLNTNVVGNIFFETQHYNGGGSLDELIEQEMKKL